MSIRTNGDSALFALEYVYGMQVAVENPSADGRTYPVYIQGTNGKLSDEGTISIDPENERIVILKVPQSTRGIPCERGKKGLIRSSCSAER